MSTSETLAAYIHVGMTQLRLCLDNWPGPAAEGLGSGPCRHETWTVWCRLCVSWRGPTKATVMVGRSHAIHGEDHFGFKVAGWLAETLPTGTAGAVGDGGGRGAESAERWAPMPTAI